MEDPMTTALLNPAGLHPSDLAILDAITRREFIVAGGTAALLVGTGAGGSAAATTTPPSGTRTIETANGPVEVPADPRRVVCIDNFSQYDLLDIGFTPLAVHDDNLGLALPIYHDRYAELPTVVDADGAINLEQIAALEPDLILGLTYDDVPYDDLSAIAPTALFEWRQTSGDWPIFAASFADAVNRAGAERDLTARYETRAAEIRAAHADVLTATRWGMVVGAGSGLFLRYLPDSAGGVVLAAAGVQFAPSIVGKTGTLEEVSYEQIDSLADADVLVVDNGDGSGPYPETVDLLAQPLWEQLPAAEAGQVFPMSAFVLRSYGGALALLDELDEALTSME